MYGGLLVDMRKNMSRRSRVKLRVYSSYLAGFWSQKSTVISFTSGKLFTEQVFKGIRKTLTLAFCGAENFTKE